MMCKHCEDGKKMPPDAHLSVGIYWCLQCTACIKQEVAEKALAERAALSSAGEKNEGQRHD